MARNTRVTDPIDVHVGSRLRERRRLLGITQASLAEKLGLASQQVQKYERGTNRISAANLFRLGVALEVPVGYFMEGLEGQPSSLDSIEGGSELTLAFTQIKTPLGRQRIVEMAQMLSQTS